MAPNVRQMFEWYVTGQYSVRDTTRKAREQGLAFRNSENPMPRSSVHKKLRNPISRVTSIGKARAKMERMRPSSAVNCGTRRGRCSAAAI